MNSVVIRRYTQADFIGQFYSTSVIEESKGTVIIAPAMGISAKYYHHLSQFLADHGFHVMAIDYRGTGLSSPKSLKGYSVELFDWGKDISDAIEYIGESGEDRIYFIGHSIGSQLLGFAPNNKYLRKAVFLASSIGYWRLTQGTEKWLNFLLLNTIMPFSHFTWGYTNAKAFGQGENYPRGAAEQWRKWCMSPQYLEVDISPNNNFFRSFDKPLTSFIFSDDNIANPVSAQRLLSIYSSAQSKLITVSPQDYHVKKIGHTGFLSRSFRKNLWESIKVEIQGTTQ